jgi:hypothetical protein
VTLKIDKREHRDAEAVARFVSLEIMPNSAVLVAIDPACAALEQTSGTELLGCFEGGFIDRYRLLKPVLCGLESIILEPLWLIHCEHSGGA